MSGRYVVGRAADIPDGGRVLVEVGGRQVGVFNVGGSFYGLINRCPHKGAEMCKGNVVAGLTSPRPGEFDYDEDTALLMCPWHGWEFDVRTGQSWFDPRTRLRTYDVEVTGADQVDGVPHAGRVPGPYTAETVEVGVEDEYVVVDLRKARKAREAAGTGEGR
ncbi:Rieske (2Fe-2S) protein [Pseudonocardia halophobica]|uniref:(2Fe-2S) ferredoxin n=1 Tax=Pseudonocardia halophobica TaxID=29401 RepID=A0A9W6NYZ7_9PSEU|nr:Rieske (2Fe-2S) protein [Pseudonocardia halophobica]GLL14067.1 (2Fe-2S) ferredoxin [Pseudonocardia halophobica]